MYAEAGVTVKPLRKTETNAMTGAVLGLSNKFNNVNIKLGDPLAPPEKNSIGIHNDDKVTISTRDLENTEIELTGKQGNFIIKKHQGKTYGVFYIPHDLELYKEYKLDDYEIKKGSTKVYDKNNKLIHVSNDIDIKTLSNYQKVMFDTLKNR